MKIDNYFYLENFSQSDCDSLVKSKCYASDGKWYSNPNF